MKYMLDTDCCVELLRGRAPRAVEKLAAEFAATCAVSRAAAFASALAAAAAWRRPTSKIASSTAEALEDVQAGDVSRKWANAQIASVSTRSNSACRKKLPGPISFE